MKEIVKWIIIVSFMSLGIYSIIVRFQNPNLTETELLLKIIGYENKEKNV